LRGILIIVLRKTGGLGYLSIFTAKSAKVAKDRRLTAENAEAMET